MRRFLNWFALPTTASEWGALSAMQAGGLLGWMTTPSLWIFCGPFRWAAMLGGMASQESAYNSEAIGDVGESIGILQFSKRMWADATGVTPNPEADPRLSPFGSGYAAAKYVRIALVSSPRWWLLATPVYGFAVLRYMWTCGTSQACAIRPAFDNSTVFSGASRGIWTRAVTEGQRESGAPTRGLTAFFTWRLMFIWWAFRSARWAAETAVSKYVGRAAA